MTSEPNGPVERGGPNVTFKRLSPDPDWPLPSYASSGSVGLDLSAHLTEPLTFSPGQIQLVPTGWAVALPAGYEGQVRPRSGLALRKGLTLINSPATIDWDYRGEIALPMINLGHKTVVVERGDRVAQMVIAKVEKAVLTVSQSLEDTRRGSGGFGSTGR
ncbi:MAG: dUTP diphosphatase [Deltaproteobacteria bacterium]|jgi:dUTP pyrophosphatase|nr:dUTP diphosphatase [Deltaproteobacteria bacterium]